MPNCKEHTDCDLVCGECGSYYCQTHNTAFFLHINRADIRNLKMSRAVPVDDMPDDIEAYRNEKAGEMP